MLRNLADLVARLRTPNPATPDPTAERDACVLCNSPTREMPTFALDGVCTQCDYHHALSAWSRIRLLADPDTFRETGASTTAIDPLAFPDGGDYRRALREAFRRTALREAALTGTCEIGGRRVMLILLDFGFLGGSMGVVVGERVTRAFEDATRRRLPVISIVTSSGMRLREGLLALGQMAKTTAAAQRHHERELPHIAVLGNPTTGGVFASFTNLADVIIGEPAALMGYASLRTMKQLEQAPLPPDAHTAEAHLAHGLIDQVVGRTRQRDLLTTLLDCTAPTFRLQLTRKLDPVVGRPVRAISPWSEVELARHARRPTALDYIARITSSFVEIRGDRLSGDDPAVVAGFADLSGQAVMIIGQQRHEPDQRPPWIAPEGFRKATRALRLAEKFGMPVLTLVDTQGALPSREAEEHGIGHAIAEHLATKASLKTPVVSVIIGEGGSEAALAFGVADRVLMLEHAIFSIVSPEDAARTLYRDAGRAETVAGALRLTAHDALELGAVDQIVREPAQGAHEQPDAAAAHLRTAILQAQAEVGQIGIAGVLKRRYARYRRTRGYQNFFRVSLGRNLTDLRHGLRRRLAARGLVAPPLDAGEEPQRRPVE